MTFVLSSPIVLIYVCHVMSWVTFCIVLVAFIWEEPSPGSNIKRNNVLLCLNYSTYSEIATKLSCWRFEYDMKFPRVKDGKWSASTEASSIRKWLETAAQAGKALKYFHTWANIAFRFFIHFKHLRLVSNMNFTIKYQKLLTSSNDIEVWLFRALYKVPYYGKCSF